jgi:hypothetical protein
METQAKLQKIKNWFHNHMHAKGENSEEEDNSEPPHFKKFHKKWSLRRVVQHKKHLAIKQRMEELSQEAGEMTHPISLYPTACTQICNELTNRERLQFEEFAEQWNKAEVPKDVQQK